ncbi:MAG: hypothetical protein LBU67_08040 [Oscillospiraceae bacterium]|jgi:hypothetical protein|nr:hypothetical protein [Oscillospiraceae bacterium]
MPSRRALACLLAILVLLPSGASAATTTPAPPPPLPYEQMRTPAQPPAFTQVDPTTRYAMMNKRSVKIYDAPRGKQIDALARGDLVPIQDMPDQYANELDYYCLQFPRGYVGYALVRDVIAPAPDQWPAYAVDTSCAPLGYLHAAARGNGHLMLVITTGEKTHQLLLPNDGQWHAMLLTLGPGDYTVSVDEVGLMDLPLRTVYAEGIGYVHPPSDQALALLSGLHTEVVTNPKLAAHARKLCEGAATDKEKFLRIRSWLYGHAGYDAAYARGIQYSKIPDPNLFLQAGGKGICVDYAAFIAVACRAVGVPCQHVYGINPRTGREHAWNLVWLDDQWQLCDVVTDRSAKQRAYKPVPPDAYPRKAGYWDGFQ